MDLQKVYEYREAMREPIHVINEKVTYYNIKAK